MIAVGAVAVDVTVGDHVERQAGAGAEGAVRGEPVARAPLGVAVFGIEV